MAISLELNYILLYAFGCLLIYYIFIQKSRKNKLLAKFPGPVRPPIIGHTLDLVLTPKEDVLNLITKWAKQYGPAVKVFSGPRTLLFLNHPKYVEKLLASNTHIQKGFISDFMRRWLGDGLFLSVGQKWSHRRKMLTPAFHFKILEDFMPIMNKASKRLVEILKKKHGDGAAFDIVPHIPKCTMDIICETSLGIELNAQDGENLEYSQAIREMEEVIKDRSIRPWYYSEFIYKLSSMYKREEKILKFLYGFTDYIIQGRKKLRAQEKQKKAQKDNNNLSNDDVIYVGKAKKRNAFLDLLLDIQEEVGGNELTDQDIRGETTSLIFAGHDTTSVSVSFTLFALGAYPEIQEKVYEELSSIFGDDKDRPVSPEDLTRMKYLECVIKESLRLYPSAPFILRQLTSDLKINDEITIPADVTVVLFIYYMHKNPEFFPNPDVFDPERFSNVTEKINPYAYIPFSAGPKNCLGQKFAMMEEKIMLSYILRNFHIKSLQDPKHLKLQSDIVLCATDGLHIQLTPR